MPSKRMGRPPGSGLPAHRIRTERVTIMLLPREIAKLERLAAKRDLPVSTYGYELLAGALRHER